MFKRETNQFNCSFIQNNTLLQVVIKVSSLASILHSTESSICSYRQCLTNSAAANMRAAATAAAADSTTGSCGKVHLPSKPQAGSALGGLPPIQAI